MLYIILFLISIAGGYVAFRYISLLRALKQIQKELDVIQQDLSKNQMIHLPVPNNRLKELLITINSFLDELHHERARYTKQEKEFQKQIENISHDLRTPLTSLLGYVRLYKKSQSSYISQNAELSDTLDVIERKSESLKNLITQFYDFSRLTAHDYTVNLIKIDTVKLLRESFADNCHILEETHLNVSLDLPDRPIYVLADKTALERIFFNLFQNAGRYAHTFFHITIKNEQNSIKILFANDTCSLSSEDISHLFDRFYIQESARSQGGTGLGLTIARSLAEEIGGELSVSSKKSNGNNSLLILLTLPLTKETRHLMNEEKFSQMKDGAILVNIARGAVVDTEALMREMPRLGGAVLDVFEEEPLREDSPLWEMEKVIVTPHNSFVGDGNARRLAGVIYENIRRELSDKYTSFKSNV